MESGELDPGKFWAPKFVAWENLGEFIKGGNSNLELKWGEFAPFVKRCARPKVVARRMFPPEINSPGSREPVWFFVCTPAFFCPRRDRPKGKCGVKKSPVVQFKGKNPRWAWPPE